MYIKDYTMQNSARVTQGKARAGPSVQPSLLIRLLAWLLNGTLDLAQWSACHGERLLTEYRVLEWFENVMLYATQQPIAAVVLGIGTVVCGVPIFVFACFAIISSLITFTGFLFIEGTLLTIGFGILIFFLLIFGSITLGLFTAGAATYLGLQRLRKVLDTLVHFSQQQVTDYKSD